MDNYLQNRHVIQKELKTVVSYVSIVIVLVPRSLMVVARSLMVVASKLMKRAVITTEVFKTTCWEERVKDRRQVSLLILNHLGQLVCSCYGQNHLG